MARMVRHISEEWGNRPVLDSPATSRGEAYQSCRIPLGAPAGAIATDRHWTSLFAHRCRIKNPGSFVLYLFL